MLSHPLHHDLSSISPGSPSNSAVSVTRYTPRFFKGRDSFLISEFSSEFCIALTISTCRTFSQLHSVTLIISSSNPHQVFVDGLKICLSRNCVGWNVAMKKLVIETRKLLFPTWLQLFCFTRSFCIFCLSNRVWYENVYCHHLDILRHIFFSVSLRQQVQLVFFSSVFTVLFLSSSPLTFPKFGQRHFSMFYLIQLKTFFFSCESSNALVNFRSRFRVFFHRS